MLNGWCISIGCVRQYRYAAQDNWKRASTTSLRMALAEVRGRTLCGSGLRRGLLNSPSCGACRLIAAPDEVGIDVCTFAGAKRQETGEDVRRRLLRLSPSGRPKASYEQSEFSAFHSLAGKWPGSSPRFSLLFFPPAAWLKPRRHFGFRARINPRRRSMWKRAWLVLPPSRAGTARCGSSNR